jgi:hypothetical protein
MTAELNHFAMMFAPRTVVGRDCVIHSADDTIDGTYGTINHITDCRDDTTNDKTGQDQRR